MVFLEKTDDSQKKLELLETLRTVTEGKIFVELERARLTRILVGIKEGDGKIDEACDLLQDVQVETIGAMDKREKTSYILDQMRLCLAKGGTFTFPASWCDNFHSWMRCRFDPHRNHCQKNQRSHIQR